MTLQELKKACIKRQAKLEEKYNKLYNMRNHLGAVKRHTLKKEHVILSLLLELASFSDNDSKEIEEEDSITALKMLLRDRTIM